MNIGIICYPTFGGSGIVATELGIELAKLGHQVHFITYQMPARLVSNNFLPNIYYHEVRMYEYPLFDFIPYESVFVSQLFDIVVNNHIDLLHIHYAIPFASIGYLLQEILAEKKLQIPFITTLHGTDITLLGKDKSFAPILEFSINKSTVITAVSEFLRNETHNTFKMKREIQVIYNFIDLTRYQDSTHDNNIRSCFAPKGEPIITHISNFRKVKRATDTVHIFHKIRAQRPVKLLLIGDGPERLVIEELCREHGYCKDIFFLGKQEKIEGILMNSDLFLLPSESESFGLSALEAMAAGVPVISSNVGGLPEVNLHNFSGFLASVGDVETMSNYCIRLLDNPNEHQKFRQQAKMQAQKFSKENIIPKYLKLYQQVLAQIKT